MNQEKEIEKIKYQLKQIAEIIDYENFPIQSLILYMDWGSEELNKAHDIFEEYDKNIENKENFNWTDFESKFQNMLGVGYQTLKMIVLAFHYNHQWNRVTKAYAENHQCVEFDDVLYK